MFFVQKSVRKALSALTLALTCTMSLGLMQPANAGEETLQCGIRLYNAGHYANAKTYLQTSAKEMPYDPRPLYYQALLEQKLGHTAAARGLYAQIVNKFPDSEAGENAKKGLGMIDFGSGYDRPGGSLKNLNKLRMDVMPQDVTIKCQEKDGRPLIDVLVDNKKVPFVLDASTASSYIGQDVVRKLVLNDKPVNAQPKKAGKDAAKETVKETVKEASKDASKEAPKEAPKEVVKETAKESVADTPKDASKETPKESVKDSPKDVPPATTASPATTTTTSTSSSSSNTTTGKSGTASGADSASAVNPVKDANVVLYDMTVGTIQRPAFPIFLSTVKPDQAVLGRDFLGPYKTTFNATAKTLTLVRDRSYGNPFATGMALFNKGKFQQAVPFLKKASEARLSDPRTLYCYAVALQHAGNIEGAKTTYRQVMQRFPDSEATFYSTAALSDIDPSFARERAAASNGTLGTRNKESGTKVITTFDVPYTMDGNWIVVRAYIDSQPVAMSADLRGNSFLFSTPQLNQIDPNYANNLEEVSRVTDDTNLMMTTITKIGTLKFVRLGQAEKFNVPIKVVDQGPLKFLASWISGTPRPILPIGLFTGWRFEVMSDLKVLRFTKLPGN